MKKWQYKILDSKSIETSSRLKAPTREDAEQLLNELGADGWEITHLDWRELEHRMSFMGLARRELP